MVKMIEATYRDGNLILSQTLHSDLEGKKVRVLVFETPEIDEKIIGKANKKNFLEHAKKFAFKLPEEYQFNREEIYKS